MAQNHHPSEKVSVELHLEWRCRAVAGRSAGHVYGYIAESHALGLVELLEAIDQRPALNGNAAGVLDYLGVGLERLRDHFQANMNAVAGHPAPPHRQILTGSDLRNELAVHGHLRMSRPTRNAQVQGELCSRGWSHGDV